MDDPANPPPNAVAAATPNSRPIGWMEWIQRLFNAPLHFFYNSLANVALFLYTLIANPILPVTDPRGDVRHFIDQMAAKYAQHDLIPWIDGSYDDALRQARRTVRFLIVYLHNPNEPRSERFIQTFLLTEHFHDFLQHNDCLVWGASITTGEGRRVSRLLAVLRCPFIGLMSRVPNADDGLECVLRLTDTTNPDEIFTYLMLMIEDLRPHQQTLIQARMQQDNDRQILREQEQEYARSLAADQEKKRERQRLVSEREEAARTQRAEQEKLEKRSQRIAEMRERIKKAKEAEEENGAETVQIKIQFPDGASECRRFAPNDSLEALFNAVLIDEHCPENFTILSVLPYEPLACVPQWYRREFPESEGTDGDSTVIPTFQQAGLCAGGHRILVRNNEA